MPVMRTTLTIDDDLIQALKVPAHQRGISFKVLIDETLRRGLSAGAQPPMPTKPFRVMAAMRGFRPVSGSSPA
jgi:plasmid stability protein